MKKGIHKLVVIFALPAAEAGYACLDHLKQYLTLLFSRQLGAT